MFQKISFCFIFLFSVLSLAQENIIISGIVHDDFGFPIEEAEVKLFLIQDSTLIANTLSDSEGGFKLEIAKQLTPVYLRVEEVLNGEFEKRFDKIIANQNLKTIVLNSQQIILSEVMIKAETPPLVVRNDTIEYNAASFKVRPDANLETLLKELPGVEMDENGKITVNGKDVSQILIDGKPFFGTDGKLALENIPADIISKVQVSDYKTKKEEFSGEKAKSDNSSINVTLKEDKKKGYMVKAALGYGTDDRYEAGALANYFQGERRLSLILNSNNVNASGLSMGGNMRAGRMVSGVGQKGLTTTNNLGLNYNDKLSKSLEIGANYYLNHTDTDRTNYTQQENFLPDNYYTTTSNSESKNESLNHSLNTNLEYTKEKLKINFRPSASLGKTTSSNKYNSNSTDEFGNLKNENFGETETESNSKSIGSNLSVYQKFDDSSYLNMGLNLSFSETDGETFIQSSTLFYEGTDEDDIRNQRENSLSKSTNHKLSASYTLPINKEFRISLGGEYNINKDESKLNSWDYNAGDDSFNELNKRLSRKITSNTNTFFPYSELNLEKEKFSASLVLGSDIIYRENKAWYMDKNYALTLNKVLPNITTNLRWKLNENSNLQLRYAYNSSLASASQYLEIEDYSDPLHTVTGNSDLDPNRSHRINASFRNNNRKTKQGYFANLGYTYNESSIVSYSFVDENLKTTSTYRNISGNYNINAGLSLFKSYTYNTHKFRLSGGLSSSYSKKQAYRNSVLYEAYSTNMTPNLRLSWDWGELLTISPSYFLRFNHTKYENYRTNSSQSLNHMFGLQTTTYWPKKFTFSNDFNYNHNSNMAAGFKRDFFMWNASLSYKFFQDKMSFSVKVYDLLGQNSDASRTITDEYIRDERDNVLTRYVMFSLTYNLNKFGGKSDKGERSERAPRL